jgi:hypothetical protein
VVALPATAASAEASNASFRNPIRTSVKPIPP